MNRMLLGIIFTILLGCGQNSTEKIPAPVASEVPKPVTPELQPTPVTDPIASIRKKVEFINTTQLEKKHFEFVCDVKMMVDYFYSEGKIVKIAVDFGTLGDSYAREGYYYDEGELIFNYEFVEGGPACEGCIKTDEYRTYIKDHQVIKYLKNQEEGSCRKCDFSSSSRQYRLLKATTAEEIKAILCR